MDKRHWGRFSCLAIAAACLVATSGCFDYATVVRYKNPGLVGVEKVVSGEKPLDIVTPQDQKVSRVIHSDGTRVALVVKAEGLVLQCALCEDQALVLVDGPRREATTDGEPADVLAPSLDEIRGGRAKNVELLVPYTLASESHQSGNMIVTSTNYFIAGLYTDTGNVESIIRVRKPDRNYGWLMAPGGGLLALGVVLISKSAAASGLLIAGGVGLFGGGVTWLVLPENREVLYAGR
jgi:hypothetical protein